MVASLQFIDMHGQPVYSNCSASRPVTNAETVSVTSTQKNASLCGILDNDSTADMSYDDILEWMGREGEPTRERRLRASSILTNELLPT